jgi:hypothetical protein
MTSAVVGQLIPDDVDPDFSNSEPFPIPYFDNKPLKVVFFEAEHQPYLEGADRALGEFVKLTAADRIANSEKVYQYYAEVLKYGYTSRLNIKTVKDVWNFVSPGEIMIHWGDKEDFYVCVSCWCAWEEEHGLELVFKNGKTLTRAGGHGEGYEDED